MRPVSPAQILELRGPTPLRPNPPPPDRHRPSCRSPSIRGRQRFIPEVGRLDLGAGGHGRRNAFEDQLSRSRGRKCSRRRSSPGTCRAPPARCRSPSPRRCAVAGHRMLRSRNRSRPEEGSSSIKMSNRPARQRASSTRRLCPVESDPACRPARSAIPHSSIADQAAASVSPVLGWSWPPSGRTRCRPARPASRPRATFSKTVSRSHSAIALESATQPESAAGRRRTRR